MANPELYPLRLVRAVNSWQAGSLNKEKKAKVLRDLTALWPSRFRGKPRIVYRQIRIHNGLAVPLLDGALVDAVSSWTTSNAVAKGFREKEYDPKKLCLIYKREPSLDEVMLRLDRLFEEKEFVDTIRFYEESGHTFKSLRRYWDTQKEVILQEVSMKNDELLSIGAYRNFEDVGIPQIGEPKSDDDEVMRSVLGHSTREIFWTGRASAQRALANFAKAADRWLKDKGILWEKDRL